MKTLILVLSLLYLFFFTGNINSQSQWTSQNSNTLENINDVNFPSVNTGYAVANNGLILKTINQGTNWFNLPFPNTTNNMSVFFTSIYTGYVGSPTFNYIYKTVNGGYNWTPQTTVANQTVISIKFSSMTTGWAGDVQGNIIKTTNAGLNWNIVGYAPGSFTKIYLINNDRAWIADNLGYVTYTTNAGNNFSSVKVSSKPLNGLFFISSTQGYVVGDSGRIYRTTNGGVTWQNLPTGTTANLKSITGNVVNSNIRLWAVGAGGKIIESYNGGGSWFQQNNGTADLNAVAFPSNNIGFIVGNSGRILFTNLSSYIFPSCIGSDVQQTGYPFTTYWMDGRTEMLYTAAEILQSGAQAGVITKMSFYVAGYNNQTMNGFKVKIQNTSQTSITGFVNSGWSITYDGVYAIEGSGWRDIVLQAPFYWDGGSNLLIEICYNNSSFTNYSNVLATSAPGMTWSQYMDLPTGDGCVDFTAGNLVAPRPNICFNIQPLSGTGNSNAGIPKDYSLYQNYPNPFNPTTKIRFDNPKSGNVTLKVYDLLGKEVALLVNETKQAGSYIVDFNGQNLSSGVYFYKLESGNYTDVKRMILIR